MDNFNTTDSKTINLKKEKQNAAREAEAWPDPVDGHMLFDDLTKAFNKYLALQPYQAETLALWSIFSHSFNANNIAPKLLVHSPEKRCGKSTLMDVLSELAWQPVLASNITPAVIFRVIESVGCTLMIDEADTFLDNNPEMTGIINSGHRKKIAVVWRCHGDNHVPKAFSTWAPTVIAMIGKPQDTIVDRSILITMRRKTVDEKIERYVQHRAEIELKELSQKIARWCKDNFENLCNADPQIPEGLHDRAADNWRPLLGIADLISEQCSSISRAAAMALNQKEEDEDSESASTILLTNIHEVFEALEDERISTQALMFNLVNIEDSPWAEWNRGKEITARQVARLLKPFDISPKKMRMEGNLCRGYERVQFKDAFSRYLSGTAEQCINTAISTNGLSGTVPGAVPHEMQHKSFKDSNVPDVPHVNSQLLFGEDRAPRAN